MVHMTPTIPGYLTPLEAAARLECGRTYVYALIERKRLATRKVSGRLLIDADSFAQFEAARKRRPVKTTNQEGTDQ